MRLHQIDFEFPVKGWLGFHPIFLGKNIIENIFVRNFFSGLRLFFLGWLARFSHDKMNTLQNTFTPPQLS